MAGEQITWEQSNRRVERGWFPDSIYDGIDTYSNSPEVEREMEQAEAVYLNSLSKRNVKWQRGDPLKSLHKRMLSELSLAAENVEQIAEKTIAWCRQ